MVLNINFQFDYTNLNLTELSDFNISDVLSSCINILQVCNDTLRSELTKSQELQLVNSLHLFLQKLLTIIDKSCSIKNIDDSLFRKLYYCLRRSLAQKRISMKTFNNIGILLVSIDYNFFELTSSIRLLKNLRNFPYKFLAVCYGFAVCVPSELLLYKIWDTESSSIFLFLLESSLSFCSKFPSDCLMLGNILTILSLFTQRIIFTEKNVPLRLLNSLLNLLWSHLNHFQDSIKYSSKECLTNIVLQKDDYCLNILLEFMKISHILNRQTCSLILCLKNAVSTNCIMVNRPEIITDLLNIGKNDISHSYVLQTFISLMVSNFHETDFDHWFESWIEPLFCKNFTLTMYLEEALLEAIKLSPKVANKLPKFCHLVDDDNYLSIIKCISVLNICSFQSEKNENSDSLLSKCIPLSMMKKILRIAGDERAVATIHLIMGNKRRAKPITSCDLELFKIYLETNILPLNKKQRSIFFSLVDRIITKVKTKKREQISQAITGSEETEFFNWLKNLCYENLFVGASYARWNTALKIIHILNQLKICTLETISEKEKKILFLSLADGHDDNKIITKNLLLSLRFPNGFVTEQDLHQVFEKMIQMLAGPRFCEHATTIYLMEVILKSNQLRSNCNWKSFIVGKLKESTLKSEEFTNNLIENSWNDKPSIVYLRIFLELIKKSIIAAGNGFSHTSPLYGYLTIIRRLLNFFDSEQLTRGSNSNIKYLEVLIEEIIEISIKSNVAASSVVAHLSPEGYLPQEDLDDLLESDISCFSPAQRLLLFSWRSVKEASLLLSALVEKFSTLQIEGRVIIGTDMIMRIGDHLKCLILKIRHRGAFEQVYIALSQFCRNCWKYAYDSEVSSLPKQWLIEVANRIEEDGGGDEFCVSRRSAGVPYIVHAVLSTEYDGKAAIKQAPSPLLDLFVKRMFQIWQRAPEALIEEKKTPFESSEAKIHATNTLRALFRSKELAVHMSCYIEEAVKLSVTGIQSSSWNERNVCWLLFASLITRIFGVARSRREISDCNKMTAHLFFRKYPSLYDFFKSHLKDASNLSTNDSYVRSSTYLTLLVFARFQVSCGSINEQYDTFELHRFIPLLHDCTQSAIWKIRELAVSAILPLITPDIYVDHLRMLWQHVQLPLVENSIHGVLLQLEALLLNVPTLSEESVMQTNLLFLRILKDSANILKNYKIRSSICQKQLLIIGTRLIKLLTVEKSISQITELETVIRGLYDECIEQKNYLSSECERFCGGTRLEDIVATLSCISAVMNKDAQIFDKYLIDIRTMNSDRIDVFLEIVYSTISSDYIPRNVILRNKISEKRNDDFLKTSAVYDFLLNTINVNNCGHLFLIIRILKEIFEFRSVLITDELVKILESICQKCYTFSEDLTIELVSFVNTIIIKNIESDKTLFKNICYDLLEGLVKSLQLTYSETVCREMIIFFLNHCEINWTEASDTVIGLEVWSFSFKYALSNSYPIVQDLKKLRVSENEDRLLLDILMDELFAQINLQSDLCAATFISLMFRDVGYFLQLSLEEENHVFTRSVPSFWEDDLIIGRKACKYLSNILMVDPKVLHSPLNDTLTIWITKQCGFEVKSNLLNFIRSTVEKYKSIEENENIDIRFDDWKKQIISGKISLFTESAMVAFLNHM